MREAGCMAHARRKFHDLFVARGNEVNSEALHRIGELYAIESAIRGKPRRCEDVSGRNRRVRYSTPSRPGCARH
nr:transposase [Paraburkholderia sprentiae]